MIYRDILYSNIPYHATPHDAMPWIQQSMKERRREWVMRKMRMQVIMMVDKCKLWNTSVFWNEIKWSRTRHDTTRHDAIGQAGIVPFIIPLLIPLYDFLTAFHPLACSHITAALFVLSCIALHRASFLSNEHIHIHIHIQAMQLSVPIPCAHLC